jgi:hypothetical protein
MPEFQVNTTAPAVGSTDRDENRKILEKKPEELKIIFINNSSIYN